MKYFLRQIIKEWIAPLAAVVLIFGFIQPTFAQIFEQGAAIYGDFAAGNNVKAGSETLDGYQQVYYILNGQKKFITHSGQNGTQAVIDGEYIAYVSEVNGAGQIFLYHIPSDTTIEITTSGTNLEPRLSNGKIVWERWTDDKWQVFLFDGVSIRQVTEGDLSVNPDINESEIVYARKNAAGEWRALRLSLGSDQAEEIKSGVVARYPKFKNGKIIFPIEDEIAADVLREEKRLAEEAKKLAEEEARLAEAEEPSREQEQNKKEGDVAIEPTSESTPEPTFESTPEPKIESTPEPTFEATPELTPEPSLEPTTESTPEQTADEPQEEVLPGETSNGESSAESTVPETVSEEDIVKELEGESLVKEEVTAEEADNVPSEEENPAIQETPVQTEE